MILVSISIFVFSCAKKIENNMLYDGLAKKPSEHKMVSEFKEDDFYGKDLTSLSDKYNNVILCAKVKNKKEKIELGCSSHHLAFKCNINGDDSEKCIKKFIEALKTEEKYY